MAVGPQARVEMGTEELAAHPPSHLHSPQATLTLGGDALHEHVDDNDGACAANACAGERRGCHQRPGLHLPRKGVQSSAPAITLFPLPPLPASTARF